MPRSSSASSGGSKPILGRALAILALPLTPISNKAKCGLVLFKKRAASASRRAYKPFRHYNYAYVGEYQFSPSRSPLLPCPPPGVTAWRRAAAKKRRGRARAVLASLLCGGDELDVAVLDGLLPREREQQQPDGVDRAREREQLVVVAPAALEWGRGGDEDAGSYAADEEYYDAEEEEQDDDEVDDRAERFIQRFYEEMRLQRQSSLVQQRLL